MQGIVLWDYGAVAELADALDSPRSCDGVPYRMIGQNPLLLIRVAMWRGGGTGRRAGLKIQFSVSRVWVRLPPAPPFRELFYHPTICNSGVFILIKRPRP